ncbi:ABC transporter permease [Paracoccus aminophilus]|uniref:ABC-type dipeptide/oligopeptide/nickel transport system, permease component n=1 Tax=Paracoccus aminophilus JCM 7686 TaxID=1367847 RepID=S5Y7L2_PARAH|nr:ABC transporter permease [Paracoccus aminophilus]AGT07333.1 ABC-type dipeptide/oligopeptide/nickel transport system, permease component [Paracoccus aminophilus JCM 7686]
MPTDSSLHTNSLHGGYGVPAPHKTDPGQTAAQSTTQSSSETAKTAPPANGWSNIHAPDARSARVTDIERRRSFRELWLFLKNPNALFGMAVLLFMAGCALTAPWFYPKDPLAMVGRPLLWPGQDAAFPLGTDSMGRDVLAGLMHGARISLYVGLLATAIGLGIGVTIGAVAGYFGGLADRMLSRIIVVFQTLPAFVLVVVLVAITNPSATTITIAIAIVTWPTVARLTRAEFRSLRQKDFVMAAKSLGYGHGHIIFREILPNALPPIIVTSSVMVAGAILMEAALSFMGFGDPNVVSWGSMIGAGREMIRTAWYLTALPGVAIVITVLSLNLIGDGLNDALNPRFSEDRL